MQKKAVNLFRDLGLYLLLSTLTFAMLFTITQYAGFRHDVGFLLLKQDYLDNTVWRFAFYTHVFSAIICLCAGFTQFSGHVLKQHRQLHRVTGKVYAYNIMVINFPAAMIMAFYANGFLPTKIAFIILDSLWFLFTLKAVMAVKKGDIKTHRQYMIRSYALTCSAVTLRLWKIVFTNLTALDPVTIYMIDAWMGFVPNLLMAEWIIRKKPAFSSLMSPAQWGIGKNNKESNARKNDKRDNKYEYSK